MANLYIAITGADQEIMGRALEALQGADIEVYRAWIQPGPFDDEAEGTPGE